MNLKKILLSLAVLLFSYTLSHAVGFDKKASVEPILVQDGPKKEWCPVCGMNLKMFYKTSHTSKIQHNKNRQYCSMRCLSVDMQEYHIDTNDIKVVDAATQKLISAKEAFYVLGSDIKGTMSKVSKIAFGKKEDAENFSMENGGEIVDFPTALRSAQESLKKDIEMIQAKKDKKIYPMGKKIFEKRCKKDIDINSYLQINELKAGLKNKKECGELKENELQALSLYLWEVKRFKDDKNAAIDAIKVTKDEKCPVCGMFVYKFPKWAAQIFYKETHLSFDGVKDMMKYYFDHKDGISKILVTDYYSQKAIDATKAYFVFGSDIYGPMGAEPIPFASKDQANTFYMDHKGTKVSEFKDITKTEIYKLDE